MTPNDVKVVLHEVLGSGVFLNTTAYVIFLFGWLIATALAAGLGSYFGKRGETAAVRSDLEKIKDQLRQTTQATEETRAVISGGLWVRQARWNFRREVYTQLLQGLSDLKDAVASVAQLRARIAAERSAVVKEDHLTPILLEEHKRMIQALTDVRRQRAIAEIIVSAEAKKVLDELTSEWRKITATDDAATMAPHFIEIADKAARLLASTAAYELLALSDERAGG